MCIRDSSGTATFTGTSSSGSAQYKINSGSWTNVGTATVASGDTVQVRTTSDAGYSASEYVKLEIGSINDIYTVVTASAPPGPPGPGGPPGGGEDP